MLRVRHRVTPGPSSIRGRWNSSEGVVPPVDPLRAECLRGSSRVRGYAGKISDRIERVTTAASAASDILFINR
jgi:hypothetical protein